VAADLRLGGPDEAGLICPWPVFSAKCLWGFVCPIAPLARFLRRRRKAKLNLSCPRRAQGTGNQFGTQVEYGQLAVRRHEAIWWVPGLPLRENGEAQLGGVAWTDRNKLSGHGAPDPGDVLLCGHGLV
jgi:hypothetical protein